MAHDLNYSVEDRAGVKVIHLSGNLSNVTAEEFEKLLAIHTHKSSVILNMERVELITSSGINSIVNACIEARNMENRILLLKPNKAFRNMINVLKAYDFIVIVDSIEEGLVKISYYV
jgi:anti-anti-sigma factor